MHFLVIELSNQVSIDYFETTDAIALQHLAFLVSEADFDVVLGRLRESVPQIWADPARTQPGEINHFGGGRGVYFQDPDGHSVRGADALVRRHRLTTLLSRRPARRAASDAATVSANLRCRASWRGAAWCVVVALRERFCHVEAGPRSNSTREGPGLGSRSFEHRAIRAGLRPPYAT